MSTATILTPPASSAYYNNGAVAAESSEVRLRKHSTGEVVEEHRLPRSPILAQIPAESEPCAVCNQPNCTPKNRRRWWPYVFFHLVIFLNSCAQSVCWTVLGTKSVNKPGRPGFIAYWTTLGTTFYGMLYGLSVLVCYATCRTKWRRSMCSSPKRHPVKWITYSYLCGVFFTWISLGATFLMAVITETPTHELTVHNTWKHFASSQSLGPTPLESTH